MQLQTLPLRIFPTPKRVLKLASLVSEFASCPLQRLSLWPQLLRVMSSLSSIVPGSHLRMRSPQLWLNSSSRLLQDSDSVSWDASCLEDLRWWSFESHLLVALPLGLSHPSLSLFTDTLDSGWGGLPQRRPHVRLVVSELFPVFHQTPLAPYGALPGSGVSSPSPESVSQPVRGQHHRLGLLVESRAPIRRFSPP